MQSELKPCPFCGGDAVMQEHHWRDGNLCGGAPFCRVCGIKTPRYWPKRTGTAITAWNTRASDAEITRLTEALRDAEEEKKALREALESKPWPPTDADLREMLALIVGAWWSESSANRLRTARVLNAEDIKGMYAVRDALAPYIARAALKGPSHDK